MLVLAPAASDERDGAATGRPGLQPAQSHMRQGENQPQHSPSSDHRSSSHYYPLLSITCLKLLSIKLPTQSRINPLFNFAFSSFKK